MNQNPGHSSDADSGTGPGSDPGGDPGTGDLARETDVQESDPNADSPEGLAGGMGVSSELVGEARGSSEPVTYGTLETHPDEDVETGLPEQSPGGPDVHPDQPPLKQHHPRAHG